MSGAGAPSSNTPPASTTARIIRSMTTARPGTRPARSAWACSETSGLALSGLALACNEGDRSGTRGSSGVDDAPATGSSASNARSKDCARGSARSRGASGVARRTASGCRGGDAFVMSGSSSGVVGSKRRRSGVEPDGGAGRVSISLRKARSSIGLLCPFGCFNDSSSTGCASASENS